MSPGSTPSTGGDAGGLALLQPRVFLDPVDFDELLGQSQVSGRHVEGALTPFGIADLLGPL